jgi:hypothetical protein
MPYMDSTRQITVGQPVPHDASRRAGSAGVSAPLAEFYMAKGRFLRPKARPAHSAATGAPSFEKAECREIN